MKTHRRRLPVHRHSLGPKKKSLSGSSDHIATRETPRERVPRATHASRRSNPPNPCAFFECRLAPSPFFFCARVYTREPHFSRTKKARELDFPPIQNHRDATSASTVLRARRHRKRRSTLATVFSKSVGLAPASFTIFTRDIFLFAVWCVRREQINEEKKGGGVFGLVRQKKKKKWAKRRFLKHVCKYKSEKNRTLILFYKK